MHSTSAGATVVARATLLRARATVFAAIVLLIWPLLFFAAANPARVLAEHAPAALDHFTVVVDGNQTAGTAFDVTVTAYDELGILTDYDGSATLSGSLGSSAAGCGDDGIDPCNAIYGDLTFSDGIATGSVTAVLAETGAFVTVTDDTVSDDSNLFDVAPGELDHLVLTPASDSPIAGTDVTYEAEGFDAYDNSRDDVTDDTTLRDER